MQQVRANAPTQESDCARPVPTATCPRKREAEKRGALGGTPLSERGVGQRGRGEACGVVATTLEQGRRVGWGGGAALVAHSATLLSSVPQGRTFWPLIVTLFTPQRMSPTMMRPPATSLHAQCLQGLRVSDNKRGASHVAHHPSTHRRALHLKSLTSPRASRLHETHRFHSRWVTSFFDGVGWEGWGGDIARQPRPDGWR